MKLGLGLMVAGAVAWLSGWSSAQPLGVQVAHEFLMHPVVLSAQA